MSKENVPLITFNRGVISKLALARIDLKRTAMSAEIQENWSTRVLGSMMMRPGLGYIGGIRNNLYTRHVPFIYSSSDTALIELTNGIMRVRVDEEIIERTAVSTTVADGTFSGSGGWTDIDEAGATGTISGGVLSLVGTRYAAAGVRQQVSVTAPDQNVEHALNIVVTKGKVTFRCGSTSGGDEYIAETSLGVGNHSLAFTPTGDFYVQFTNLTQFAAKVDSCTVEASGAMEIATPWLTADLPYVRRDQSADVVYLACVGYQQRKIERRGPRSWSVVLYAPEDGPFRIENTSTTRLSASAISGDITLTASRAFFKSTNVGSLFKMTSIGQRIEATLTGADQYSDPIRITGVGASQRTFAITRSGTWSGTLTLQRSVGEVGAWVDVTTYTTSATTNYNDGLDNQIIYYRVGFKTGNYTSGTAGIELVYANGGLTGIVRVTAYSSPTSVSAEVLTPLGGTGSTEVWSEGEWSPRRGHPTCTTLYEGRLWFAGKGKIFGSASDAYESFDEDMEGDSAPINRSIGSGPVDNINWLLPLNRLLMGTQGAEWSVRSSSFDEPLTNAAFNMKDPSTQGSAAVAALKIDDSGLFVQKSGTKLYRLDSSSDVSNYGEYSAAINLNELAPEIGEPGIAVVAAQRQPDTRIHCVRSDGKVAILVSQPVEDVLCWLTFKTAGDVEDVVVLPGLVEDKVYYVVKRVVGGNDVRYLERWAMESECVGGTLNKQADSYITYTGVATTTLTGLTHLEGCTVVVWGNGKDLGTKVVAGGQITGLSEAVTNAIVGLKYQAPFKGAKLAYAGDFGTALTQVKRVHGLGLILSNTHYQGLKFGRRLEVDGDGVYTGAKLDSLPLVQDGLTIPADYIWEDLEAEAIAFPGGFETDARLCLLAEAPRPCTILAAVVNMKTNG